MRNLTFCTRRTPTQRKNEKMKKLPTERDVGRAVCACMQRMHVKRRGQKRPGLNQTKWTSCHKWHGGRSAKMKKSQTCPQSEMWGVLCVHACSACMLSDGAENTRD